MTVSAASRVRPCPDVVVVEEQGTVYVIPPLAPATRLNRIGSLIWRTAMADGVAGAVAACCEAQDCTEEEARTVVVRFLDRLAEARFVEVAGA